MSGMVRYAFLAHTSAAADALKAVPAALAAVPAAAADGARIRPFP
ncbi:hypothetical protein [Streptomyces sp. CNQ-509]|nr:hypothetical protein [Streptomyces sp. CNQ-509]